MKKLLLLSILTISFSISSYSQTKEEDLKTLSELMNGEKMMSDLMKNIFSIFEKQAKENIKGEAAQEKYQKFTQLFTDETTAMMKKIMSEDMPAIYDKYFTQEDIRYYISFYKSESGKKMLEKTPEITKELMNSMMTKRLPTFQEKMSEMIKSLKIEGDNTKVNSKHELK
jgi:uncharacterized protein